MPDTAPQDPTADPASEFQAFLDHILDTVDAPGRRAQNLDPGLTLNQIHTQVTAILQWLAVKLVRAGCQTFGCAIADADRLVTAFMGNLRQRLEQRAERILAG